MAQARARPGQARIPGPGPGLGFLKPKPDEARPEPWAPNFRNELENLANLGLLTLSQTPAFWTKIDLNCVLWRTSSCLVRTVALLASTLRRGRDLPLILQITPYGNIPLHPRVFHLLASHSRRWVSLTIFCNIDGIYFSGLEGRLPILEKLQFDPLRVSPPNPFNYLKGAPALRRLHVTSPLLDGISSKTLQNLVAYNRPPHSAADVDNILVHFRVGKWSSPTFAGDSGPNSRQLDPAGAVGEGADVVLITDTLLRAIKCAVLGPDRAVDSTSLIPQLRVLRCASRLQFTHNLLLEFVSSRLELAPNSSPFLLEVRPLTETDGRLDAEVHERLEAMWSRRRRFGYCFGSAQYPALL
ncbi:hypothetical protein B0H11DRAFT_2182344 [Mycena galericulata]|nr:hypothetical protein B0H11DRAFT_2182344 [Mycena galericulata]